MTMERLRHVWQCAQVGTPEAIAVAIFIVVELLR
jgi:hypothetical protein